eukprot:Clim_evm9s243 gene=Clim_evmTU9s243
MTDDQKVINAHGLVMGIAWLVLAPLGIFLGRFMQKLDIDMKVRNHTHMGIMFIVWLLTIIGAVLAFVSDGEGQLYHKVIAYIVFISTVLLPYLGYVSMQNGRRYRPKVVPFHRHWGWLILALGIYSVFSGIAALKPGDEWFIVAGVICGVAVLSFVSAEIYVRQKPAIEEVQREPAVDGNIKLT